MTDHTTEAERIRRITNTPTRPTLPPVAPKPTKPPLITPTKHKATPAEVAARHSYLPAPDLWQRTLDILSKSNLFTPYQVDSWLRPCELLIMELPSGAALAAKLNPPTTHAADYVRMRWAAEIRACLMQLTRKQVALFIRGSDLPTGYW